MTAMANAGARAKSPLSRRPGYPALCCVAAFILFSTAARAAAGDPPKAPPASHPDIEPQVTIEGRRATLEHRVHEFVSGITAQVSDNTSLTRWTLPICPLVAGLTREQGEFILARLTEIARSAGVRMAGEQCRPNFYVVATREPVRALKLWRRHDRHLFGNARPAEIRRFLDTPRPVRVWYNDKQIGAQGNELTFSDYLGNQRTNRFPKASRLEWNEVQTLSQTLIILDTTRVKHFKMGQLADYVALVGLTEINLDAGLGDAPSILHLFDASGPDVPAGLSKWDQAFLEALYHTPHSSRNQTSMIAVRMTRAVEP